MYYSIDNPPPARKQNTVGKSLTQKSDMEDTIIQNIMEKYYRTKQYVPNTKSPLFGDFTNAGDFQTSLEKIEEARKEFMKMPPKIRKRFDNDPAKLIEFIKDVNNEKEAIELGFIEKPKAEETPAEPAK